MLIRNITGTFTTIGTDWDSAPYAILEASGVFTLTRTDALCVRGNFKGNRGSIVTMSLNNAIETSYENHPYNIFLLPLIAY